MKNAHRADELKSSYELIIANSLKGSFAKIDVDNYFAKYIIVADVSRMNECERAVNEICASCRSWCKLYVLTIIFRSRICISHTVTILRVLTSYVRDPYTVRTPCHADMDNVDFSANAVRVDIRACRYHYSLCSYSVYALSPLCASLQPANKIMYTTSDAALTWVLLSCLDEIFRIPLC